MSRVLDDTTGSMAARLLEGWGLSDVTCSTPGCNVPLLTKAGEPDFCANCHADASALGPDPLFDDHADSDASSASGGVSTPPTPSVGLPADLPPPRIAVAQRDAAAREIGELLLKGWCLLGDECPNCPGVPLMSQPRIRSTESGGSVKLVDGRPPGKYCVSCRTLHLAPGQTQQQPTAATSTGGEGASNGAGVGGAAARKRQRMAEDQAARREAPVVAARARAPAPHSAASTTPTAARHAVASAGGAELALEHALEVLSGQMDVATAGTPLNVPAVGELAETMGKAARALQDVRAL